MKRLYAVVLALALCLGLAACGTGNPENDTDDSSTSASDSTGTQDSEGSQTESTASVLYFTGFIGDFGLNDMGWNAANAAAEVLQKRGVYRSEGHAPGNGRLCGSIL